MSTRRRKPAFTYMPRYDYITEDHVRFMEKELGITLDQLKSMTNEQLDDLVNDHLIWFDTILVASKKHNLPAEPYKMDHVAEMAWELHSIIHGWDPAEMKAVREQREREEQEMSDNK